MKKNFLFLLMTAIFILGILTNDAIARQEWISDILANPARHWNVTVTIVGQVQKVTANPPGTTRGTYTLLDDSSTTPIIIRTKDLPPIGKTYQVTGVVIQDPTQANVPIINEINRTTPGFPLWMKYLLIGGGSLFLVLLIIFIVLLVRPKGAARAPETIRPTVRPAAPPAPSVVEPSPTRKVPTTSPPYPEPDKTRAFLSLGAEIIIEKGPDKGQEFTLHKQVTTIGHAGVRKNDVELTDDTVSKEQASIFYDNTTKEFFVKNESITNPTQVNQKVVTGSAILKNNDAIEMGATVLRFRKD